MRKTYATNLSDEEWASLRARLPELLKTVRMRAHALRDVFDAIFYVLRSGCPWRMLPGDFPPWSTVYYHFRRFRLSGLWHRAFAILRAAERKRVGKYPDASTAILVPKHEDHRGRRRIERLRYPQERQGPKAAFAGRHLGSTAFDLRHSCRRTRPGRSALLTRWAGTADAPSEEDLGRRRVQWQGTRQVVRGAGR